MDTKPYPIIGMSPGNSYFKDVEIRHLSLLTFVSEGRADITFVELVLAKHFQQETGRNIVRVQDLGCLRKFPNTFMISPGQESLLETLNKFITVMIENGSVSTMIEKYLGSSDALVENMDEITMA
jgi:ABC-type amino acid transport substrate-binding protein